MFVALHCVCLRTPLPNCYEHRVSEPPTDTNLQEVLEGSDSIYEAKEDVPGVRLQTEVPFHHRHPTPTQKTLQLQMVYKVIVIDGQEISCIFQHGGRYAFLLLQYNMHQKLET